MYPKRDPIDIEKNPMEINGLSGISWDDLTNQTECYGAEQSKKFAQAEHMKHMKHLTIASFPSVPVRVPKPSKIKARCCCSITSIFEGFIWKAAQFTSAWNLWFSLDAVRSKWRTNDGPIGAIPSCGHPDAAAAAISCSFPIPSQAMLESLLGRAG